MRVMAPHQSLSDWFSEIVVVNSYRTSRRGNGGERRQTLRLPAQLRAVRYLATYGASVRDEKRAGYNIPACKVSKGRRRPTSNNTVRRDKLKWKRRNNLNTICDLRRLTADGMTLSTLLTSDL